MVFWKKNKQYSVDKDAFSIQNNENKDIDVLVNQLNMMLQKLDRQEKVIDKQTRQIEGLLEALNNINDILENNNIVLREMVKNQRKGPDLLMN